MSFKAPRYALISIAAMAPWSLAGAQNLGESSAVPAPAAQLTPMSGHISPEKHNGTNPNIDAQQVSAFEQDPKAKPMPDSGFMREAAMTSRAQLDASRIAQSRAADPKVRQFAQHVVADQQAVAQRLTALAGSKSVALPEELDAKRRMTLSRLEKLDGASFDKAYIQQMVHDQDQSVSFYATRDGLSHDPDVRAFVQQSLPTLQQQDELGRALLGAPSQQAQAMQ